MLTEGYKWSASRVERSCSLFCLEASGHDHPPGCGAQDDDRQSETLRESFDDVNEGVRVLCREESATSDDEGLEPVDLVTG